MVWPASCRLSGSSAEPSAAPDPARMSAFRDGLLPGAGRAGELGR
jgi:hypothetical protein